MFTQDELSARIAAANDQFVSGEPIQGAPLPQEETTVEIGAPAWQPIDIYRHHQMKQMANAKKEYPKGSRAIVKYATEAVINGGDGRLGLARSKKKAENDSELLARQGYKDRAEIAKRQYMEEQFLPAVEVVIEYSSPDELLNCKEALAALDKMALGVGSMSGYTAAYVRQAYGNVLGQKRGGDDQAVANEIMKIKSLVASDQMRAAVNAATRLKQKIDNGERQASPEDYAILGRMVAYAN